MKPFFADTAYYLAMLNPRDPFHAGAMELSRALHRRVVTTEFVLTEVANFVSRAPDRHLFVTLFTRLRANPDVTIVPASSSLFGRGFELYANRPDKDWSLTDCISFVVMDEHGLTEALTSDHHFEQAGFRVLLE
jgi:predicted nucleic acid-binding protein